MSQEIETILAIWQPSYPRQLTAEDGREIAKNVVGFFTTLARWDEADRLLGNGGGASCER